MLSNCTANLLKSGRWAGSRSQPVGRGGEERGGEGRGERETTYKIPTWKIVLIE